MTKKEFIDKYSKVSETLEDEFRSQYNSPELMWESLKGVLMTPQRVLSKTIEDTVQEIIDNNLRGEDFVSLCEKKGLKPSHIERLMNNGKKY